MMVPTVESRRMEKMVGLSSDRWWYSLPKKKKKKMVGLSSDRWWYEDGGIVYQRKKEEDGVIKMEE